MFSRSSSEPKTALRVGLITALLLGGIGAWWLIATPAPAPTPASTSGAFTPFTQTPAHTTDPTASPQPPATVQSTRTLRAPTRALPPSPTPTTANTNTNTTPPAPADTTQAGPRVVIVKKRTTSSDPITLKTLPAHPDDASTKSSTKDPDGRTALDNRIVGPARWMAQPDPATERAIHDTLKNSRAPAELARQQHTKDAHLSARALIQQTAVRCARKLPPHPEGKPRTGQMAVTARLSASGTTATLQQVNAQPTYLLNTPEFHACFQGALIGATFPATGDVAAFTVQIPARVTLADLR